MVIVAYFCYIPLFQYSKVLIIATIANYRKERKYMFSEKTSFVLSIFSIILGAAGILTAHYIIGGPLAMIGYWLSIMSVENCENKATPIIGVIVSIIGFAWFAFLCISVDKRFGNFGLF